MTCKEELIQEMHAMQLDFLSIRCAAIRIQDLEKDLEITLTEDYDLKDMDRFLDALNFEYRESSIKMRPALVVSGTIWFRDGSWMSRACTYGPESWRYNWMPTIPEKCKK
jgi:hypothetical protein